MSAQRSPKEHHYLHVASSAATIFSMEKALVFIVGVRPSGLAVAACLTQLSIPYVLVEREDCSVSPWCTHMVASSSTLPRSSMRFLTYHTRVIPLHTSPRNNL